jgi:hypothetical protein
MSGQPASKEKTSHLEWRRDDSRGERAWSMVIVPPTHEWALFHSTEPLEIRGAALEPGAIPFAGVVQGVNYEAIAENPPPDDFVPRGTSLAEQIESATVLQLLDRARQELVHTCDISSECLACDIDITLQPASRPTKRSDAP